MARPLSAVDIGNRALQHVGAELMDITLGFSENSKRAQHIANCYDSLRQAELQRVGWRFAIKKAALRAVDSNTMLLSAALWGSLITYSVNSIVIDQNNTYWRSLINNNNANPPGQTGTEFAWEPYFGPLSVALYDSSQAYYAGELVYTMAGDGTYNVYYSGVNANAVHPALFNQWASTTTYFTGQVVVNYPAWSNVITYLIGNTIVYTDGNTYTSLVNANLNHPPSTSTAQWALQPTLILQSQAVPIFGNTLIQPPQSSPVLEWTIGNTYSIGTFVMFDAAMWVSIANSNTGNLPDAAGSIWWAAVVGGTFAASAVDLNFNNNPLGNPVWNNGTAYDEDALVTGSDGNVYTSLIANNFNHDPTLDVGINWTMIWNTHVISGGNSQWTAIGGAVASGGVSLTTLANDYPLNMGPVSGLNGQMAANRNMYRLPAGYLCLVMQDPKAGSISFLGSPSGLMYRDWAIENDYIVTQDSSSIVFRFIADFTDVPRMNPLFCEGLAARIAEAVCEPLTQSAAKIQSIRLTYKERMGEARLRNAIEVGAEEPPMDDYISTRY
jgi:hypothetical protein